MPRSITLIYAHPYPDRSRAGRTLVEGVRDLPFVALRSLYDLYPDFSIDVEVEQQALTTADVVVWQCPFHWYGMPALLHLWIEKVLAHGWAYGPGGDALLGKRALWATTTGAAASAYQPTQMHGHPFAAFVPGVSQTARFCGMHWQAPFVVHGVHRISDQELRDAAQAYRRRLQELAHTSLEAEQHD